ncbi:ABC transporter ATP-binding protein [Streptomyces sp. NPDC004647]|uniref:ABC transporter ATP-binding protein n=1 Tax=Streptomyces sp. NPDC004647 TaxID=3154671 RepID=UPI0033AA9202
MLKAGSTAAAPALQLEEVRRVHSGGCDRVTAPAGVTLGFERGTFTALVGPSGSGKSMLMHCAAGLDRPDSGRVVLDGVSLGSRSERELALLRRGRVGLIFGVHRLQQGLTVYQNIAMARRIAGHRAVPQQVDAVLRRLGLCAVRHRPMSELSDGGRQRVTVAQALVSHPAVILADEPTGALDAPSARQVLELLRGYVRAARRTVVMATHDPVAASYADRVIFLRDGAVEGEVHRPTAHAVAERLNARP